MDTKSRQKKLLHRKQEARNLQAGPTPEATDTAGSSRQFSPRLSPQPISRSICQPTPQGFKPNDNSDYEERIAAYKAANELLYLAVGGPYWGDSFNNQGAPQNLPTNVMAHGGGSPDSSHSSSPVSSQQGPCATMTSSGQPRLRSFVRPTNSKYAEKMAEREVRRQLAKELAESNSIQASGSELMPVISSVASQYQDSLGAHGEETHDKVAMEQHSDNELEVFDKISAGYQGEGNEEKKEDDKEAEGINKRLKPGEFTKAQTSWIIAHIRGHGPTSIEARAVFWNGVSKKFNQHFGTAKSGNSIYSKSHRLGCKVACNTANPQIRLTPPSSAEVKRKAKAAINSTSTGRKRRPSSTRYTTDHRLWLSNAVRVEKENYGKVDWTRISSLFDNEFGFTRGGHSLRAMLAFPVAVTRNGEGKFQTRSSDQ